MRLFAKASSAESIGGSVKGRGSIRRAFATRVVKRHAALVVAALTVLWVQIGVGSAAAGQCPNESIRDAQDSTGLPECRAYEMVSPPDKNSSDVASTASRVQSTPEGNAVTFISSAAFPGSSGTGAVAQYLSERGSDGWRTRAINPFQRTNGLSFIKNSGFKAFDANLGAGIFVGNEPTLDPAAPVGVRNLYLYDVAGNKFSVLTTKGTDPASGFFPEPYFAAASDDYSHILFEDTASLTPDAPEDGTVKLYESVDGVPELVGLLPGDVIPTEGAVAGNGAGQGPLQPSNNYTASTLSSDGSRVIFKDVSTGQLYSRVDGTATLYVSASQRTEPDPVGTQPVTYRGASTDGKRILFSSCAKLTNDSTANCEGALSEDLYEYDADTDGLAVISEVSDPAEGPAQFLGVLGESDDGSYIYFAAEGRLTSDAPASPGPKLYLWHDGIVQYITLLANSDLAREELWASRYTTGAQARVTPDGRSLLFITLGGLAGVQGDVGQAYLYNAETDVLRCLSCDGAGSTNEQFATLSQVAPGVPAGKNEYRDRALLPDGSMAFFSTPSALVPEDHNGVYDVYEWDAATNSVSLISTGGSPYDSYFVEAGADGRDVFFTTRQRLSANDVDNNVDLYDARSGGGFPELVEAQPECRGERCQGEGSPSGKRGPTGSEAVDVESPPKVRLMVGRASDFLGTWGRLAVQASVAGQVTLKGPNLAPVRRQVRAGKRISMRIRLNGSGRRKLNELGAVSSDARLYFVATDGRREFSKVALRFSRKGNR